MSENIHTFSHTFSDGQICTITCDLSNELPIITSSTILIKKKTLLREYDIWSQTMVMPAIYSLLTPIQCVRIAQQQIFKNAKTH
jgi:hypothetical protein